MAQFKNKLSYMEYKDYDKEKLSCSKVNCEDDLLVYTAIFSYICTSVYLY